MKNPILLVILTFTLCHAQEDNTKIITQFLEQVILNKSYKIENINEFVDINKEVLNQKKEGIYNLLQIQIDDIRQKLQDNSSNYEVITHYDVKYSKYIKEYNLTYDDYDNVYYLINIDNKEIITFFILYKGKIRAFFFGITKKQGQRNPWLLNTEQ